MITPYLEQLIHCGKAAFRTITIGGTEKAVLNVDQNTYIVIVGMIYFPRLPNSLDYSEMLDIVLTQVYIGSKDRQNTMIFRNNHGAFVTSVAIPTQGTPIFTPLYLIHTNDVSVSFTDCSNLQPASFVTGNTAANGVAGLQPLDYGKVGDPAVNPVLLQARSATASYNFQGKTVNTTNTFTNLTYGISGINVYNGEQYAMPLIQLHYVVINDNAPTNLIK